MNDDIKNILFKRFMKRETIRHEWVCDGWDSIVSTQNRLFFIREGILEKSYIEVPYNQITSLQYGKMRPLNTMIKAVILWVAALIVYFYRDPLTLSLYRLTPDYAALIVQSAIGLLTLLGIILAVIFALGRTWFTIHINGRSPIRLTKDLVELWEYIREEESKDPFPVKPG
ncbi:hypothetical protein ES703_51334 [subsurface metagenome]